jgi:hypothetical protein
MNQPVQPTSTTSSSVLRPLLWSLLVLGAVGNAVASAAAASITVHLAVGLVTALALTALVVDWVRNRS